MLQALDLRAIARGERPLPNYEDFSGNVLVGFDAGRVGRGVPSSESVAQQYAITPPVADETV